jgi:nucleoside-diphosphate-sugar epimerase
METIAMDIFLTGGESFVGRVLWNGLEEIGHSVTGIDVVPSTRKGCRQLDLRDPRLAEAIPEGAVVLHLAAISTDPLCRANPLEALDVNVTGTLRLAQAAVRRGCRQFIFASTEWVYGDVSNDGVQVEDQPIDVTRIPSVYAFSKVAGERILVFSGLPNVTILRFGIIYGPRERNWSAVESLVAKVQASEAVSVGSLETSRRFIHVRDLCAGIVASIGIKGIEVLNLTGDDDITLRQVIATADVVLGRQTVVTETNPAARSVRTPSNAKARTRLGWRPDMSFEDGVRDVVESLGSGS